MAAFLSRLPSIIRNFSDAKTLDNIVTEGYKIVSATGKDEERVLELMRKTFFKDEPAIAGCGMTLENFSESLQRFLVSSMSEGRSLLAVDAAGRLLGVCLNRELRPGSGDTILQAADKFGDPRAETLFRFWAHLYTKAGLPEALGADLAWEVETLATDPVVRGRGIAKALTVASREEARKAQYQWLCVYCTSEYSGKLCRSLGMRLHLDLPYSEYRDASGRQIVKPPAPHLHATVYVEDLMGGPASTKSKSDTVRATRKK